MAFTEKTLKIDNTNIIATKEVATGVSEDTFEIVTGGRVTISVLVVDLDPSANVTVEILNGASPKYNFDLLDTAFIKKVENYKKSFNDVHSLFRLKTTIFGGNATVILVAAVASNAPDVNITDFAVFDKYNKKISQLTDWSLCGVDTSAIGLLKNKRCITITLNDGTLIYTE